MSAEIIADARSTLTAGVVGSLAGAGAVKLGNMVLQTAGVNPAASLGDDLITFIVQGISSSLAYSVAASAAPEASSNLYFNYVFFSTSSGMTDSILRLVNRLIETVDDGLLSGESTSSPPRSILGRQASQQSSCAHC